MEIAQYFEDKTLFISGATGFLAKLFVEEVLRIQPKVKKLFLLIRATPETSIEQRLQDEVLNLELFRVVQEEFGSNASLLRKIVPVSGDVSMENLGITDSKIREEIWRDVDIIVNSAATTKFYERYDVALGINAFGVMHLQNFARRCSNLKILLHVSTAYVNGTRGGVMLETPFHMGETLPGAKVSYLDINTEKMIVEERLRQLQALNAPQKKITSVMKDLGFQRATSHGWPNTYVFTKAMGEMMILKDIKENDYNVIIMRPAVITSTYREPFPGWIEGLRTFDVLFAAYGKAKMTIFIGDPQSIVDIIPGDMVVNCMLAAIARHSNQPSRDLTIYHVGSSRRNPICLKDVQSLMYNYLLQKPFLDDRGKPIKVGEVTILSSMSSFHRYIEVHYRPFLKMLKLLNVLFCDIFGRPYTNSKRTLDYVMRMAELYGPYLFFQGIFDDANTEGLRVTTREHDSNLDNMFGFDPKCIHWEEYLMNTHFPGIVKYALK